MAQMKYYYELTISSSPHIHSPVKTNTIMRDVVIALMPALAGSVFFFGFLCGEYQTVGQLQRREQRMEPLQAAEFVADGHKRLFKNNGEAGAVE